MANRQWRHKRIRAKVKGTKGRPRIFVFRSNKYVYVQFIDDEKGITLLASDTGKIKKGKNQTDKAKELGREIAERAKGIKINKVVFDRGGYKYHGKIKAVAEGLREGGLNF